MTKIFTFIALVTLSLSTFASDSWTEITSKAKGQTVYFHAWGGSQEVNRYIQWAASELKTQYGIKLKHVKVSDISKTTAKLVAEKTAGKNTHGSVDMVWINGENFKSMKDQQLLLGPFVSQIPNWKFVDKSLPIDVDFSEPTEGLEAPWGVGQLVFIHDKTKLNNPPLSFSEMLSYAQAYPKRLTYPKPPSFHGTSFLKALLIELTDNDKSLSSPVDMKTFSIVTEALWSYLDSFHQVAWRDGKQFPSSSAETIQLLDDNQIDLAITFNPNAVYSAQANGKLTYNTAAYAMKQGALSNIHFLAIPWNSSSSEAAMVTINFLLGPQAQSHKGDTEVWGDPSVLQREYLSGTAKKSQHFKAISEPHPSWQTALEKAWLERYGK